MNKMNRSETSKNYIFMNAVKIKDKLESLMYAGDILPLLHKCDAKDVKVLFDEGFLEHADKDSCYFTSHENKLVFEVQVALEPEVPNE